MSPRYDPPSASQYRACLKCQTGGGIPYFDGSVYQRGYGIGGMFRSLITGLMPLIPKLKSIAGRTVAKIAGDHFSGLPIKRSIKKHGLRAGRSLLLAALKKSGRSNTKKRSTVITKKARASQVKKIKRKKRNPFD